MATNIPKELANILLTAGMNTAYTAPSGTAVVVNSIIIASTTSLTSSAVLLQVFKGPTASPGVWFPYSAVTARNGIEWEGNMPLNSASQGIIVSAASGNAFNCIVGGWEHIP